MLTQRAGMSVANGSTTMKQTVCMQVLCAGKKGGRADLQWDWESRTRRSEQVPTNPDDEA